MDYATEIATHLIDSGQFMVLPMLTTRQEAIEKLAEKIRGYKPEQPHGGKEGE